MAIKTNRRRPDTKIGRKVVPARWITTSEEVLIALDSVQLALEAASKQLFRCTFYATSLAVQRIAAEIPVLKKLARQTKFRVLAL